MSEKQTLFAAWTKLQEDLERYCSDTGASASASLRLEIVPRSMDSYRQHSSVWEMFMEAGPDSRLKQI